MYVCSNGGSGSGKLIGHIGTFRCSYTVSKINNSYSNFKRQVKHFVSGHKSTAFSNLNYTAEKAECEVKYLSDVK